MEGISRIFYRSEFNRMGRLLTYEQQVFDAKAGNAINKTLRLVVDGIESRTGSDLNLITFFVNYPAITHFNATTGYHFGKYDFILFAFPREDELVNLRLNSVGEKWMKNNDLWVASDFENEGERGVRIFEECDAVYYSEGRGKNRIFLKNIISGLVILNESPLVNPARFYWFNSLQK
ncbi:MAG: hypothetical protein AABX66_01515 [Nanoarchaeota archaeon]